MSGGGEGSGSEIANGLVTAHARLHRWRRQDAASHGRTESEDRGGHSILANWLLVTKLGMLEIYEANMVADHARGWSIKLAGWIEARYSLFDTDRGKDHLMT